MVTTLKTLIDNNEVHVGDSYIVTDAFSSPQEVVDAIEGTEIVISTITHLRGLVVVLFRSVTNTAKAPFALPDDTELQPFGSTDDFEYPDW